MSSKFSIGEIVRIKATGEKVKIGGIVNGIYLIRMHAYYESELKPYCPSRTGKYRNKKGQFCKGKIVIKKSFKIDPHLLEFSPHKIYFSDSFYGPTKPDSKQRNYQKIELVRIKDGNGSQVDKNFEFLAKRLNQVIEKINSI